MDPLTAMIVGGAQLGSAWLASSSAQKGQQWANETNMALAREQMAFQRESMQMRHQWEVEDLKRAGLNPILSAGGQPPVLSGALTHVESPTSKRADVALATARLFSEMDLMRKQSSKSTEESKLLRSEQDKVKAEAQVAKNLARRDSSKAGEGMYWVDRALRSVAPIAGLAGGFATAGSIARNLGRMSAGRRLFSD